MKILVTIKVKTQVEKAPQKLLDLTKQSAIVAFKTASKRTIQKTAETTGGLFGIKNST